MGGSDLSHALQLLLGAGLEFALSPGRLCSKAWLGAEPHLNRPSVHHWHKRMPALPLQRAAQPRDLPDMGRCLRPRSKRAAALCAEHLHDQPRGVERDACLRGHLPLGGPPRHYRIPHFIDTYQLQLGYHECQAGKHTTSVSAHVSPTVQCALYDSKQALYDSKQANVGSELRSG